MSWACSTILQSTVQCALMVLNLVSLFESCLPTINSLFIAYNYKFVWYKYFHSKVLISIISII